jgi:hypothetical protein
MRPADSVRSANKPVVQRKFELKRAQRRCHCGRFPPQGLMQAVVQPQCVFLRSDETGSSRVEWPDAGDRRRIFIQCRKRLLSILFPQSGETARCRFRFADCGLNGTLVVTERAVTFPSSVFRQLQIVESAADLQKTGFSRAMQQFVEMAAIAAAECHLVAAVHDHDGIAVQLAAHFFHIFQVDDE